MINLSQTGVDGEETSLPEKMNPEEKVKIKVEVNGEDNLEIKKEYDEMDGAEKLDKDDEKNEVVKEEEQNTEEPTPSSSEEECLDTSSNRGLLLEEAAEQLESELLRPQRKKLKSEVLLFYNYEYFHVIVTFDVKQVVHDYIIQVCCTSH